MNFLQRLFQQPDRSLRLKLLVLALLPLAIVLPLLISILAAWASVYYDRLLIGKVRSDLAVAHGYFEQIKAGVGQRVEALAASEQLALALRANASKVDALLSQSQSRLAVDFLHLLDADGRVIAGSHGSNKGQSRRLRVPLPERTEVLILNPSELQLIDPALADKARMPLLPTKNALPTHHTEENRGMVIWSSASAGAGRYLVGGLLLNKNHQFVDRINEIVYPQGTLPLGSAGTATLFLDDVRIATNVSLFEGERAIGTRVSAAVRHSVLDEGQTWLDRAFVVDEWYVSAYEPIINAAGIRIGMLYVGFLESPFQHARQMTLGAVALLFVLATSIAVVVSLRLSRRVSKELAEANESLQFAQHRLSMSEKLAAIGQLAAGVAHEVNNPLAVIQGNLDVMRELLGNAADPVRPEIRLIQDQVFRIRKIVTKLLQFSRPADYSDYLEPIQLDQVVQDCLVLVAHQVKKTNVRVVEAFHTSLPVMVNPSELQQVLINLIVNALQAMALQKEGTLTLTTGNARRDGIQGAFVSVTDTGPGIPSADRERLFAPFFTTKANNGNGLGLWVSAELAQRHGGAIEVDTPPTGGATFTVWFPTSEIKESNHAT